MCEGTTYCSEEYAHGIGSETTYKEACCVKAPHIKYMVMLKASIRLTSTIINIDKN